jgi:hypothetical protein
MSGQSWHVLGANINYNFAVHVDKDLANYTKYGKYFTKAT